MVDVPKVTRFLAFAQIIIGISLLALGIADNRVHYYIEWTGAHGFGIWIGIWMCVSGGLGIPGSGREITATRNVFAGIFMGFSIISAAFGTVIVICYSIGISQIVDFKPDDLYYNDYSYGAYYSKSAIFGIMLILGTAACLTGTGTAVSCYLLKPCVTCCLQQQGQQLAHTAIPPAGYVMSQAPGGVPVFVPLQTLTTTQDLHQPMVLVPVSGPSGYQPLVFQAASSNAMAAASAQGQQQQPQSVQVTSPNATSGTGLPTQAVRGTDSRGRGGYMPLQNDDY